MTEAATRPLEEWFHFALLEPVAHFFIAERTAGCG
jgi:hypothetical protein